MAHKDMTYEQASHAMQSGVAYEQAHGSRDGEPKFLRVGINAAMTDQSGLVRLLIAKGVFTDVEYLESIRQSMIREVERYEKHLSEKYGIQITLG